MTTTITAKPWSIALTDTDHGIHHSIHGHLSVADAMLTMPFWSLAIIRAAQAEIDKLRAAAAKPAPVGIQPIETAPHDGTYIDIWVKSSGDGTPRRVPNAQYSTYLRDHSKPSDSERYSGWFSYRESSYLDKEKQVVGWSPIPEWGSA